MSFLKDILWEKKSGNQNVGAIMNAGTSEGGITLIGTKGAGKSALLASLLIAADRRVSKSRGTEYPFIYSIDEGTGDIENSK
jgi:ABC-type phosphate/phosphonate transport system ATPase subunit